MNLVADQKLITYEENNVIIIILPSLVYKLPLVLYEARIFLTCSSLFIYRHTPQN